MKFLKVWMLLVILYTERSKSHEHHCFSSYRSFNGSCNNVEHPDWGEAGQQFSLEGSTTESVARLRAVNAQNLKLSEDPVTEWLKELFDFVLNDIFDVEILEKEVVNMATPYLDLSNLYDSTSGQLLPPSSSSLMPHLMISEHSRVFDLISLLRPGWTQKKVFLETRRIVTAEYQAIVVGELMPLLLGASEGKLKTVKYDEKTQANLSAESLLLGLVMSDLFDYQNQLHLSGPGDTFKEKFGLRSKTRMYVGFGGTDDTLDELLGLYQRLDVQVWSQLRKQCPRLSSKSLPFSNPLLVAIMEKPVKDGILGPMFSCFYSQLMSNLIAGDKFWFSNQFSPREAIEIKSMTLSSLICANINSIDLQPNVLLLPTTSVNTPVACSKFHQVNVEKLLSNDDLEILDEEAVMIEVAANEAQAKLARMHSDEIALYQNNKMAPVTSSRASPSFGKPTEDALVVAKSAAALEIATYKLNQMIQTRQKRSSQSMIKPYLVDHFTSSATVNQMIKSKIKQKVLKSTAQEFTNYKEESKKEDTATLKSTEAVVKPSCSTPEDLAPCDHTSKYRTISGRCNNLQTSDFGKSTSIIQRLLPPEFADGISYPRAKSVDGNSLPNPRKVSQKIHTTQVTPDPELSLNMMQWGQFIDHDLVLTPIHSGFKESILDCKDCKSNFDHPACFPILIPSDDSFYPRRSSPQCMAFTRSLPAQKTLGPRQQMNQVTHYLDASMIYGSDSCQSNQLRVPNSYLLDVSRNPASHPDRPMKDLLPMTGANAECRSKDGQCFLAGDARVNEQPGLTTFHTLLLREHNEVSKELDRINPHWSHEKVFQETRRIIAATIQHITYNEFLPRVIGREALKKFSLELLPSGYYQDYNPNCDPSIFTEFSTAAFRFGHSMIRSNLTMMKEDEMLDGGGVQIPLRDVFFNPDMMRTGTVIDDLVRGLAMSPSEAVDNIVSEEVSNHLFEEKGKVFSGMDIAAINIHRSRDHGIPGYNKYREVCGLKRAKNFSDFLPEIPRALVEELQGVYRHPDDVDLFPGLLAESKLRGAAVGPTLACLIGLQFLHLRSCDRFWYETGDPMLRFTKKQLQEIRGETLSGLLCRNCDRPGKMPQSGLDLVQRVSNPMMDCSEMKHIDLEHWVEGKEGECTVNGVTWPLGRHQMVENYVCTCTREGSICDTY